MNDTAPDGLTFEQSLQELERAVRELEDGQLGLEESLARYERGIGLVQRCYTQLRRVEQRILELSRLDDANRPVLTTFKHEATPAVSLEPPRRTRHALDGA